MDYAHNNCTDGKNLGNNKDPLVSITNSPLVYKAHTCENIQTTLKEEVIHRKEFQYPD